MMRAVGPIDWPAKDILRCIGYQPLRKEWDVNNEILEFNKKVGVNAFICYTKTVRKFIISSRDFVVNYLINEDADGTIYLVTSSEGCAYDLAPISGIVRGHCVITGWVFKPKKGDPSKCNVS